MIEFFPFVFLFLVTMPENTPNLLGDIAMMKLHLIIILTCIVSFSAFGQANKLNSAKPSRPDLSGVWFLETSSRASKRVPFADAKPVILVLTHQEPQLTIKKIIFVKQKSQAEEHVFYTDNRGESYRTLRPRPAPSRSIPVLVKSKTQWNQENKLRIKTTMDLSAPVGMLRERLFEEWSLSQNGKILTRKIRLIDDNENQVYQYGDVAPSRIEEWTETYRLIPQSEIDNLIKS